LVVDNETICLGDRQRRMPNVASQRVRLEPIVRRIDCRTQAGDLGRAERSPLFDAMDRPDVTTRWSVCSFAFPARTDTE